jgi:hypothetical protein
MRSIDLHLAFANLRSGKAWRMCWSSGAHPQWFFVGPSPVYTDVFGRLEDALTLRYGTEYCPVLSYLQPPGHQARWDALYQLHSGDLRLHHPKWPSPQRWRGCHVMKRQFVSGGRDLMAFFVSISRSYMQSLRTMLSFSYNLVSSLYNAKPLLKINTVSRLFGDLPLFKNNNTSRANHESPIIWSSV